MASTWIFGIILSCIVLTDCVPVEYVYTGDGCECPTRLGYQVNVPKLPKPPKVVPYDHGYKIDVPPMQAKAKVSYTFDFSVEEPRPPRPEKQPKLDLYAKVDRVSVHKADCPEAYAAPPPPPPPQPCKCGQYGAPRPIYRYVNGKWISNKCKCPKCKCHLRRRKTPPIAATTVSAIGTPIVVASGTYARNKNSIRRKRDLRSFLFRPRRQDFTRQTRYVKLYNKSLPKEKQGWFDLDLFSEGNPFKRKTKKVFFPHTGARIVKRDIKGEYDLLEKESEAADLTLPEIIQFMPETLQPDFKRGPCQFGCTKSCLHATESTNLETVEAEAAKEFDSNKAEITVATEQTVNIRDDNIETTADNIENIDNNEKNIIDNKPITAPSFTKRNAAIYGYQPAAVPPILPSNVYIPPQSVYAAETDAPLPTQSPTNPNYDSAAATPSPCEQRKIYAAMRRADEAPKYVYDSLGHKYIEEQGQLRLLVSSSSSVPDPFTIGGAPLQYTGDLEIPQIGYNVHSEANPMVGAPQYPVQHISSALLDRIITDIVYRHPDFIDASSHYGGALVDPEPYQEQQTKSFIKKLIDGRLSMLFGEPEDHYLHYYPTQSYSGHSYNPYVQPRSFAYYPAMY